MVGQLRLRERGYDVLEGWLEVAGLQGYSRRYLNAARLHLTVQYWDPATKQCKQYPLWGCKGSGHRHINEGEVQNLYPVSSVIFSPVSAP